MLGLRVRTLDQYRCRGAGPVYYKFGGRVRYRVRDLAEWAETRPVRAGMRRTGPGKCRVDPVDEALE